MSDPRLKVLFSSCDAGADRYLDAISSIPRSAILVGIQNILVEEGGERQPARLALVQFYVAQ